MISGGADVFKVYFAVMNEYVIIDGKN